MANTCITCFVIKELCILSHRVSFISYIFNNENPIISLCSMKRLGFTLHTGRVLVEVGTEILYTSIICVDGSLQNINFYWSFQINVLLAVINVEHDGLYTCILWFIHRALIITCSLYAIWYVSTTLLNSRMEFSWGLRPSRLLEQ
jgi:hypothetical protein